MPADILPFIRGRSFDEEITRIMGEAYDKAHRMLRDRGQPPLVQEVIAKRIIDLATHDERDPAALAKRALAAVGIEPET